MPLRNVAVPKKRSSLWFIVGSSRTPHAVRLVHPDLLITDAHNFYWFKPKMSAEKPAEVHRTVIAG